MPMAWVPFSAKAVVSFENDMMRRPTHHTSVVTALSSAVLPDKAGRPNAAWPRRDR